MTLSAMEKGSLADLSSFLGEEVDSRYADLLLFTCCLTSGLIDSTIYNGAIATPSILGTPSRVDC